MTLKLGPMDQVDEEWLGKKLSIGPTPIREALFRLNAKNLVAAVRGRGFFVRDITLHSIKDHQALIDLIKQGNDIEAAKVISEHVKPFQRRVNHLKKWIAWKINGTKIPDIE